MVAFDRIVLLAAALFIGGCLSDFRYVADGAAGGGGTGGAGAGGAGEGGIPSGGGGAGGGSAGGGAPALIDDGLVVRYFIDEAASGQTPAALADASNDPLDLPISWSPELSFVEVDGQRGLRWLQALADGGAGVALNGSKLQARLAGRIAVTAELVIDIQSLGGGTPAAHLFILGSPVGWLDLHAGSATSVALGYNQALAGEWSGMQTGRVVMHLRLDAAAATAGERRQLFVDAVAQPASGPAPAQHEALMGLDSGAFALGNIAAQGRSFRGTLYYFAIYDRALDDGEITHNAALLRNDDDAR